MTDDDGTEIVSVMPYDNKPDFLSSYFVGQQPTQKVKRYCMKQKRVDAAIFPPRDIRHSI